MKPSALGVVQPAISPMKAAQLFDKFDEDGSGTLNMDEVSSLMQTDPLLRKYAKLFESIKNKLATGTLGSQMGGALNPGRKMKLGGTQKVGMAPAKAEIQKAISRLSDGGELTLDEFKKLLTDIDKQLKQKQSSKGINSSLSMQKTKKQNRFAGKSKRMGMGSKKMRGLSGIKSKKSAKPSVSRSSFLKALAAQPGLAVKVPGDMPGYDFGSVNPGEMTSGTTDLTTGIEFRKFAIDVPNKGVREYWVVGNPRQAEAAYKKTKQESGIKGMTNGPGGTKALKLELEGWVKDRSREKDEAQDDIESYTRTKEVSNSDATPVIDAVIDILNQTVSNRDSELASLQETIMEIKASDAAILA